jgi:lipopolysaccharide/colanic/teichoic acid biosynthesis glycosyltransferase
LRSWKRASDLLWLPVGLAVFTPITLLIAVAILLDDGRPIFFRQPRLGVGRRPFDVIKLRTMRGGRVTRVGALLRKTGLDELPQFLNILRGEMSFVGPRPLTPDDVVRLGWTQPRHDFRWRLRPGITGLAQIRAGLGARASLAWDRLYLRRCGPLLDAGLLATTFAMNVVGKEPVKKLLLGTCRQWR